MLFNIINIGQILLIVQITILMPFFSSYVSPPLWSRQTIGGTAFKFWTDIHGPQGMDPAEFMDLITFPLAPP